MGLDLSGNGASQTMYDEGDDDYSDIKQHKMVPCKVRATVTTGKAVSTQHPQLVVYCDCSERRDWLSRSSAHWDNLAPEALV